MRLRQLRIAGFKSFADEVALTAEDGITAIVGPNGCGKSNISDAIRWVLGEQSSRSLRCTKMEDVLFNGGSEQKPARVAEVSLTLSNEEGLLALDSAEVTVTRQLHRNGESKYFLNGAPCLLRDIHELFMDTGVGRNAYSLMEQGNIDLILNTRPEDRRYLFDEVAGITKYKYRKKTALKKLDETEQNLVRINDVISELERETELLRQQAEKALQFQERQTDLRTLELELARRQWEGVRAKLCGIEEQFREADAQIQELTKGVETNEASIEENAARLSSLDAAIQSARSQVHKLETEIERAESGIALYKERQSSLSEQRDNTAAQITTLKEQIERIGSQIEEREREREQLRVALRLDESRLTGRQRVLEQLIEQIRTADEQIEASKATLIELMDEGARAQNALSTLESRAEYSQTRQSRLDQAAAKLKNDLDTTTLQLDEARRRVKDLNGEIASGKATLSEIDSQISTSQTEIRKIEAEMRGQQDTLAMAMSRVRSLEDLQKSYEGFYTGVRAVLRMHEQDPEALPGIRGVVAELIRTQNDHEQAIEVALGSGIQNVVTETAEDAKIAIQFLKKHRAGRVTFLPLDILHTRGRRDERILRYPGVVGWAPNLVETDRDYRIVVENLLGNVVVMETIDDAIHIARRERTGMRLVTLDGDIVNPGGAMSGGSRRERAAGFLQRPREIEELKERIAQLTEALNRKDVRRKKLEADLEALSQKRSELQVALQRAEIDRAGAEKDLSQMVERRDRLAQELDITQSELDALTEETGGIAQERDEVKTRLESVQKDRQALERRIRAVEEQRESSVAKREEIEASVTEMKVDLASRREKVESMGAVIASLDGSRQDAERRIEEYERAVADHETIAQELEQKIAEAQRSFLFLEQKKFEHAEEVVRLESERESLANANAAEEKELRRRRRELDKLGKSRHNFDVQMTQLQMQERAITERVQEKYRVAISEVTPNEEVGEDEFHVTEKVQELRAQIEAMGAVNLMAIEEYEEHRRRFEFLVSQRDDLEAARESLLKAIRKINETSRERFMEAFDRIQTKFQEVFQQLFGGGETELRLTDPDDVLESGIEIIARPPGKRPQSISMLSGGERSLVAIALLFAVFKIRPSPFCVLDEVDAALDEANVVRFANLIQEYAENTQFLIITHNKRTMEKARLLYGVTMQRAGVSKLVSVKFVEDADALV